MNIQVLPPGTTLWFSPKQGDVAPRHLVATLTGFEVDSSTGDVIYQIDNTEVVVDMRWIQASGYEVIIPPLQAQQAM